MHDERIADAAAVCFPLPAPERGVARERPAPGVVVEVLRPAEIVDRRQVLLEIVGHVVEELVLVDGSGGPAFGTRAVVGDQHDQCVVELSEALQELEQSSNLVIHVLAEAREHLHHAGVEFALIRRELVPVLDVRVVPGQHGVLRHDAELFLSREDPLPELVPAVVELALVLVGPRLRHVMRRMVRARREIEKERFVGRDLLEVGDERDRPIGEIFGEVIALFRRFRRLDLMVVVDEVRIVLMRVAAQKPVVPLEAAAERPAIVRAGGADLLCWRQVPLADAIRGVPLLHQHLG